LIWASLTSVGRFDTMIFSDACGIVFTSTAGAVTRARWAGDGPGFPRTWARAAPRRLEPRRAALGLEEMSCNMLDKSSGDVSTRYTHIVKGLVHYYRNWYCNGKEARLGDVEGGEGREQGQLRACTMLCFCFNNARRLNISQLRQNVCLARAFLASTENYR